MRGGLRARGIVTAPEGARLEVASRTDRGVSARANVLAVTSSLGGSTLLARLNSIAPFVWFTAAAEAPDGFRVRSASRRVYRYFDPTPVPHRERRERAAALFRGQIDVRSFGRGLSVRSPVRRTVESVTIEPLGTGSRVEVTAPSFVWGMVRKIVGALREADAGRLPLDRLEAAIDGRERLTLPMAEPEGLVLWSVEHPSISWGLRWDGPNRHQARFLADATAALWRRNSVLGALTEGFGEDR